MILEERQKDTFCAKMLLNLHICNLLLSRLVMLVPAGYVYKSTHHTSCPLLHLVTSCGVTAPQIHPCCVRCLS